MSRLSTHKQIRRDRTQIAHQLLHKSTETDFSSDLTLGCKASQCPYILSHTAIEHTLDLTNICFVVRRGFFTSFCNSTNGFKGFSWALHLRTLLKRVGKQIPFERNMDRYGTKRIQDSAWCMALGLQISWKKLKPLSFYGPGHPYNSP